MTVGLATRAEVTVPGVMAGTPGLHAGDEGRLAGGEEDEELLAKRIEVADGVQQVALGLGQRLQGDGPAAAVQERLDEVERHGGNAGRPCRVLPRL